MADELQSPKDVSPMPDSVESLNVADGGEPCSSDLPNVEVGSFSNSNAPVDSAGSFVGSNSRMTVPKNSEQNSIPACTIASVVSLGNESDLPGPSLSAFRPFITHTSLASTRENSSSSQDQMLVPSTPFSKRNEKLAPLGNMSILRHQQKSPSISPNRQVILGETNDENDDGRTTASAPPCTPAPEPHVQPQSPFRNNRQIKKIDLLAMSRSRQSDRAENARRDGRLAPSPRKKDEVLRNSGFTFPSGRGIRTHSSLRLSLQNSSLLSDTGVSPERTVSGATASPNVDVVSVDDQPDPSKCTFSIQFHDFAPAEQMMKCSLCGFVTNNQRFYRRHRRLHSRQYQPNIIHCSLCEYSTSQIRKMREHTLTNHHMSYSHTISSSENFTLPSTVSESNHRPFVQGQMYIGTGSILHPVTRRPMNVPIGAASTAMSSASTMGLPSYIPTPHERHVQVNMQAGLQHPPRGRAMLGNYAPNEQQVTDYMQSVISNLMSPPHNDPNSNVTSSNLYMQAARNFPSESHASLSSSTNIPLVDEPFNYRRFWGTNNSLGNSQNTSESGYVKVKAEPRATPTINVTRSIYATPTSTQRERPVQSPRRHSDTLDSESGMDVSSDDHASSPQSGAVGSRVDARVSTETDQTDSATQIDEPIVGTQCPRPFIKIEFPPHGDSCSYLSHSSRSYSDRGVQCEIISISVLSNRQRNMQSETVSSAGGSGHVDTRCYFCGVTFDDEVLYSIHIGCHSHTDPFVCNVCGKQCYNKYGFYSHIMRGHQARSNT